MSEVVRVPRGDWPRLVELQQTSLAEGKVFVPSFTAAVAG